MSTLDVKAEIVLMWPLDFPFTLMTRFNVKRQQNDNENEDIHHHPRILNDISSLLSVI